MVRFKWWYLELYLIVLLGVVLAIPSEYVLICASVIASLIGIVAMASLLSKVLDALEGRRHDRRKTQQRRSS